MTPTLVLTRPEAQSRALVAALGAVLDVDARIIVAPIMEIVCAETLPDLRPFAGVILTSANAVRCGPPLTGKRAFCVGESTAAAARDVGAEIVTVARNADELVGGITGPGPLVHLRGEHARGAVAQRLTEAGTRTDEAIVYAQKARALTEAARRAIEGAQAAVLPLFSPRSARLVGATVRPGPALHTIAMSPAVARAWADTTASEAEICGAPTGDAMLARIVAALRRKLP
ncbi:MAG TPA: uroporphyrinogen-III synthase [Rhodobacteraceae bacterium]|nr:uroporphyrinogen-III synthase [Paracoccaceae bacterium]